VGDRLAAGLQAGRPAGAAAAVCCRSCTSGGWGSGRGWREQHAASTGRGKGPEPADHHQERSEERDAQRYPDAIKWYEEGIKLDPKNPDASTDLGVSYYYAGRTDDALKQFEVSLKLNPKHAKTLFNKGIVLAFGKRDLEGASAAWKQVVQLAPGTPEAQAAAQGLQGIAAAQGRGAAPTPAPAPPGG